MASKTLVKWTFLAKNCLAFLYLSNLFTCAQMKKCFLTYEPWIGEKLDVMVMEMSLSFKEDNIKYNLPKELSKRVALSTAAYFQWYQG